MGCEDELVANALKNRDAIGVGSVDAHGWGVRLTEEQRVNYFDNYRRLRPERVFGDSIYLYRKSE